MALHSSFLAWRIPWTEEPGRLQSMESLKESDTTEMTEHARSQKRQHPGLYYSPLSRVAHVASSHCCPAFYLFIYFLPHHAASGNSNSLTKD